jgi:hypothetical protein
MGDAAGVSERAKGKGRGAKGNMEFSGIPGFYIAFCPLPFVLFLGIEGVYNCRKGVKLK